MKTSIEYLNSKTIIGFGVGRNFYSYIVRLDKDVNISYFSDNNSSKWGLEPFRDGRQCISPTDIANINDAVVIILSDVPSTISAITIQMKKMDIECFIVKDVLELVSYRNNIEWIDMLSSKRVHKFIDLNMHGTTVCNFHCEYCYVWRRFGFQGTQELSSHSVKEIRQGLSLKNTGGVCFINMCARGETLLSDYIVDLVYELLDEGHYVSIVTNCTISSVIDKLLSFPQDMISLKFLVCSTKLKNTRLLNI